MRPVAENEHARNNVGLVRVVLALLVIVSHSPELVDGNRSRELLTGVFGTLSFGEVAVDGFFVVSGYLITASFKRSRSIGDYLRKRVLRIFPGYVAAFCLTLFVVGPLSGADSIDLSWISLTKYVYQMAILQSPEINNAFFDVPYHSLNGSMWTISYEFRCYLLIILICIIGIQRRRFLVLILTVIAFILSRAHPDFHIPYHVNQVIGTPGVMFRFAFVFGCGALFHVFADRIRYTPMRAAVAALMLIGFMFSRKLAEPAFATLGAYCLLWFSFHCPVTPYSRFDSRVDLSYGIYLYAWPIQSLLIHWDHGISPWSVLGLTVLAVFPIAWASWIAVEQPFMRLKSTRRPPRTAPEGAG